MNCNRETLFIFLLYIIMCVFHIHRLAGEKVIVKRATCSEFFERTVEDPESTTIGWSSKVATGQIFCSICNSRDVAKSWLVTKSIEIKGYNLVHIDVQMFRAECTVCKNQTIEVYILGQTLPWTITKKELKLLENLKLIATLSNKMAKTMETHRFQFQPEGLQKVSLFFLSAGSCTRIHRMNISYFVCEKNIESGVNLNRTIAPASGFQRVNVSCTENRLNPGNETAYGLCSSEGEWTLISPCLCKQGYTLNTVTKRCNKCPTNTYKDTIGNFKCINCPKNSTSFNGESRCLCLDNFYRFQGNNYTQPCYAPDFVAQEKQEKESNGKIFIYVGVGAGFTFLVIVFIIIIKVAPLRRRNLKKDKEENLQLENCELFEAVTLPPLPAVPNTPQKTYVDPLIYVDVVDAVKEFANEIDPASLSLESLIGSGEFSHVYQGKLTLQNGKIILVAAKTLKTNASEKSLRDFFLEASAMGQFDDPNVIHLEGVITKVHPKMIVTELMSNGSLDHYLKKNECGFTAIQLFSMARGVASGMKYLAAMNFIHRDLAARNILVDENMVCKVADFGLSRELETTDSSQGEYLSQGGKIPVRWTAPEAIKYRIFTTASDVWSFGILLWEIMSAAKRPYGDWDNFKVMVRVDEGFRLPSPANCPEAVHELMLKCWNKEHILRPHFEDILGTIDQWIQLPESLNRPANVYVITEQKSGNN